MIKNRIEVGEQRWTYYIVINPNTCADSFVKVIDEFKKDGFNAKNSDRLLIRKDISLPANTRNGLILAMWTSGVDNENYELITD